MDPNKQSSRLHPSGVIDVNIGSILDDQVKNIVRELKDSWRYLDNVRPGAEVRATRDSNGQAHIYINGQGIKYLLLKAADWHEFILDKAIFSAANKQAAPTPLDEIPF